MSSLLQHHGTIRGGKVELLMYLVHHVEKRPMSCDHCGAPWEPENPHCPQCERFIGMVIRHHPDGEREEILLPVDAYKHPAYQQCQCLDHVTSISNWWTTADSEPVTLTRSNGNEMVAPKLYRIWREPVGMMGCWVGFRYNGEVHYPDLSTPIDEFKLPRDAEALTDEEAIHYWEN